MEWLEPWWSTAQSDEQFKKIFCKQLEIEIPPGHELFGIPVKLLGRGNGDDALFEILDETARVAVVHLTWSKSQERLPFPTTIVYKNIKAFSEERMAPEHREWAGG